MEQMVVCPPPAHMVLVLGTSTLPARTLTHQGADQRCVLLLVWLLLLPLVCIVDAYAWLLVEESSLMSFEVVGGGAGLVGTALELDHLLCGIAVP